MTFNNFVLIFMIFNVNFCKASSVDCKNRYANDGVAVTIDEETNNIEFHCNTTEFVSKVNLPEFSGNHFPNEAFDKFSELKEIWIDLKNQFSVFNENFFTGEIQEKIKIFVINGHYGFEQNYVEQVKINFSKFPQLENLRIVLFNFGTIGKIKFNVKLKLLLLNFNKIKQLESDTLSNLINLEELQLASNEIQVLPQNLLRRNKKLKNVYFSDNRIKEIPRKFFRGLNELDLIGFTKNQIEFLHSDLLKYNKKLTAVYFWDNKITKVSPHLFDGLINLSTKKFFKNPCTEKTPDDLTNCFAQWNSTVNLVENDRQECGKSMQLQTRVFGGSLISQGKYPWIAAFYYDNKFQCGSSLISGKHILLAAHCIHNKRSTLKDPKDCKFSLGKFNLTADEEDSLDVEVFEFILHPDWDANSYEYRGDVAVAVLTTIVEFTQFIRPLCLNEQRLHYFYNKTGTVIGWGATERNPREGNDVALEVNLKIHETRECLDLDQDLKHLITPQSFCAGNRNNTGSCIGDSGGSLIVKSGNRFKAVGVVSASVKTFDGFCDTSKNQIYTEVAAYHGRIMDHVFVTY